MSTSVRLHYDLSGGVWSDTDPVECFFETPVPLRLDAFILKQATLKVLLWERSAFLNSLADDVPRSQVPPGFIGRKRRNSNISYNDAVQDVYDHTPDDSVSFFNVRPTAGGPAPFQQLKTQTPTTLKIYELGLLNNAVLRGWTIQNPILDSYDDFPRDPTTLAKFRQELVVYRFATADFAEITDLGQLENGKRPIPESAA